MQSAGRATHGADSPFSGGFAFSAAGSRLVRHGTAGEKFRPARGPVGKHVAIRKRIGFERINDIFRLGPGKRLERQTVSDRRIARNQKYLLGCEKPGLARPARLALAWWRFGAAEARNPPICPSLLRKCAPRVCARPGQRVSDRADRRSPEAAALSKGSRSCPHRLASRWRHPLAGAG